MIADYTEYFADKENVYHELREARKAFAKGTTFEQYENLIKGLQIMWMYCPEDMQDFVQATINEATDRQSYAIFDTFNS